MADEFKQQADGMKKDLRESLGEKAEENVRFNIESANGRILFQVATDRPFKSIIFPEPFVGGLAD